MASSHVSSESQPKRQRQDSSSFQHEQENTNSKRPKPLLVQNILTTLLDQEDDPQDPSQQEHDLSAIYTTLHREISSDDFDFLPEPLPPLTTTGTDEGVESVIRHLLEASDDELGIPTTDEVQVSVPGAFTDYGLWEFEDETANYYTFLQSQLFEGFESENRVS